MKPAKKKSIIPEEPKGYLLLDGTAVTPEEAARAGAKGRKTLRNFGFIAGIVGVLVLIQGIIDLTKNGTGWWLLVFVEAVLFGFAGFLFYHARYSDDEKYGVSLLNFQKRMRGTRPQEVRETNGIAADVVLELDVSMGNALYANAEKKQWQYRRNNKLSPVFEQSDLASFDLVKNGLKYDPAAPDLSIPDDDHDQFGILLRFASMNRPSVELGCRNRQTAMESFEAMKTIQK